MGARIIQKYRKSLKILGASRKFRIHNILGTNVQNLVAATTLCSVFVHP